MLTQQQLKELVYFLGYPATEEDAAGAYKDFVKDKHKEFLFEGH